MKKVIQQTIALCSLSLCLGGDLPQSSENIKPEDAVQSVSTVVMKPTRYDWKFADSIGRIVEISQLSAMTDWHKNKDSVRRAELIKLRAHKDIEVPPDSVLDKRDSLGRMPDMFIYTKLPDSKVKHLVAKL